MTLAQLDVEALVTRFIAGAVPRSEWTHAAHLTVGLWHVDQFGTNEALTLLRQRIRRLNESNGVVNSPTGGYHETITGAYVQLLDAFLRASPGLSMAGRVERLLADTIAEKEYLLRFYSKATLLSPQARAQWVEPDLAPLTLPSTSA